MPVYSYQCKVCGVEVELDRLPKGGGTFRHMVQDPTWTAPRMVVCGTLRRVWNANFNRVPGGGRD